MIEHKIQKYHVKDMEYLHKIQKFHIEDGDIYIFFEDSPPCGESIHSFIPGSFTRELMELAYNFIMNEGISSQSMITIIGGIKSVSMVDSELEIRFNWDSNPYSIREFLPNSFTRKLLELMEKHGLVSN